MGVFVAIEGIDGVGKTRLATDLVARVRATGLAVRATAEPGGTPLGAIVRTLILDGAPPPDAELLLFAAARADHVARIRAWLRAGVVVVCDRYVDSTRAYQGEDVAPEDLDAIERVATRGLYPDLTLLLDAPVAVARARLDAGGGDRDAIEGRDDVYFARVRRRYLAAATRAKFLGRRVVVLDAARAPEAVAEQAWGELAPLLTKEG